MSDPSFSPAADPVQAAYQQGRRIGLATGALAIGCVAYINLLGVEKSILAAVLAVTALRGAARGSQLLRRSRAALALAAAHLAMSAAVLVIFRDKLPQLAQLLQKLG
ncbi:MAG TPA: hypothetical protein VII70_11265 [Steroidobacteraceae bacterium]